MLVLFFVAFPNLTSKSVSLFDNPARNSPKARHCQSTSCCPYTPAWTAWTLWPARACRMTAAKGMEMKIGGVLIMLSISGSLSYLFLINSLYCTAVLVVLHARLKIIRIWPRSCANIWFCLNHSGQPDSRHLWACGGQQVLHWLGCTFLHSDVLHHALVQHVVQLDLWSKDPKDGRLCAHSWLLQVFRRVYSFCCVPSSS